MDGALPAALAITAIGLPLLFLSLGLFYVVLSLIARIQDKPSAAEQAAPSVAASDTETTVLRAAAIAVALARASVVKQKFQGGAQQNLVESHDQTSVWWSMHHQRQLGRKPRSRRGS